MGRKGGSLRREQKTRHRDNFDIDKLIRELVGKKPTPRIKKDKDK